MQNENGDDFDAKRLKEIYKESGKILSDEEANALFKLIEKAATKVLSEENSRQGKTGESHVKNEP
ncbi:hypothetical protein PS691_00998 [Pseudomonas fluorescens]|uniref:Uncharacterized protein n=1 Tax=Pseudomonas fluorescens TaxID=294 RepID=A0A5E7AM60_PSEFL|nr:hypothetical protein PS691_00998 [Pseudomonas fluorescens]